MKIAYFDLISGASGDMILGALIDSGLSTQFLEQSLELLNISGFDIEVKKVSQKGFQATKVKVLVNDDIPERHFSDITAIINKSKLPERIQKKALSIFHKLAEVEAGIHGIPIDEVHLHELGGVDTIIDIVGSLIGLDCLGIRKISCSPVPLGRGFIQGAHGQIPLPAPATIALLKNTPIIGSPIDMELVTPTGAVLLTTLSDSFGIIPTMTLTAVGYGAGDRELPIPNLLRLIIGESTPGSTELVEQLISLETSIDDMNPELFDHVMEKLFINGALDVVLIPIQMKKNRPGTLLQVLTRNDSAPKLRDVIFEETTTLGIRQQTVQRFSLPRETKEVETEFGPVKVKIAYLHNGLKKISPEYEDCRSIAKSKKIPIREVYNVILKQTAED